MYINENNKIQAITIETASVDQTLDTLRRLIPEKEESVVQMQSHNNPQPYEAIQGQNTPQIAAPSSADELKKYKELLDNGVLTQEEFDAKKKQLLGL